MDLEKGRVFNEEILEFFGGLLKWRNSVEGDIKVVSGKRVNVKFTRFAFNNWVGFPASGRFRGW